ncbi:uncharacterized protein Z519_10226 [Cladophialophora bantiana CBS 173.52]|uniref:UBA domain-containing protein n=1 Tax=Cladophialophora bantiana (strain ATCC 10958 / CBS 173.52 / CDC B-1940 / NIH 8579) TaxID=1442370 RepID=A0A0D2FS24_CLAB1|nr:uncharacterized protein Z519_10226 [Cladophialophora bantiana CBS 173.52]KIW89372.1 hypothetical protein Z519_10226 [Cladophialophora bantiana CBS 173.52]
MADLDLDLPAFGIRDLNGPTSPPGIVQISASQYDSTIRTQPDTALSYIDLDDGELITVGSSFELQQRLEEPVPTSTPAIPSPVKAAKEAKENMLVHIFDIRHTSRSLAVWRDHEAYTTKKLRERHRSSLCSGEEDTSPPRVTPSRSEHRSPPDNPTTQDKLNKYPTVLPRSTQVSDTTTSDESNAGQCPTAQAHSPGEDESPCQRDKILTSLFTGIESHLGPLADFLESTAEGLRKIAERTAEADTTPVECVLSGFRKILKEAGELGLELLATLNEELEKNRSSETGLANGTQPSSEGLQPSSLSAEAEEPTPRDKPQPDVEPSPKKVSFIETAPTEPPSKELKLEVPEPFYKDSPSLNGRTFNAASSAPSTNTQEPPPFRPSSMDDVLFPFLSTRWRLQSKRDSIIDSQRSDSDVLTRYPPLPSLRKAVSIGGLHSKPGPSGSRQFGWGTTSALSRYPSIGQFEEQSRAKPQVDSDSKDYSSRWPSSIWPFIPPTPKKTDVYKKPTVEDEDEPVSTLQAELTGKTKAPAIKNVPMSTTVSVPGAWPDQKPDQKCDYAGYKGLDSMAATGNMSKDIIQRFPERRRDSGTGGLPQRPSSPVGTTYARGPNFPRKSQTVSGINPAARLNGPFDPLAHIPALQPRPQRSQPDLSASTLGFLSAAGNPALPDPLTYRSRTVHHTDRSRPRDPPLEIPLKNDCSTTTNSSVASYPYVKPSPAELEKSGSQPSTIFHRPVPVATKPTVSTQKPVWPSAAGKNMHSHTTGSASTSSVPQLVRSQPEVIRVPPKVSTTFKPSPPIAPASPPVSAASTISRSPSILSPCPPAFTRPRARSGISPPEPFSSLSVDECVKTLKDMGFGRDDPNELARLNVYAAAAGGDVEAAIELLEDDREAARVLGRKTDNITELRKEADVEENPWED